MTIMWLGISILVGLVFMLAAPAWADFQAGRDAYDRGDYDTALKEFWPLAEQGDALYQYFWGIMYHKGQGSPRIIKKLLGGIGKPRSRGWQMPRANWGSCMP